MTWGNKADKTLAGAALLFAGALVLKLEKSAEPGSGIFIVLLRSGSDWRRGGLVCRDGPIQKTTRFSVSYGYFTTAEGTALPQPVSNWFKMNFFLKKIYFAASGA